jgi:hypothetical protein
MRGISWISEDLLAPYEGLCCMELFTLNFKFSLRLEEWKEKQRATSGCIPIVWELSFKFAVAYTKKLGTRDSEICGNISEEGSILWWEGKRLGRHPGNIISSEVLTSACESGLMWRRTHWWKYIRNSQWFDKSNASSIFISLRKRYFLNTVYFFHDFKKSRILIFSKVRNFNLHLQEIIMNTRNFTVHTQIWLHGSTQLLKAGSRLGRHAV